MFTHAIAQFGQRVHLPGLALSSEGVAALELQGLGRLYLEEGCENARRELLIYMCRPLPPHAAQCRRQALLLCAPAHNHPLPLTAGARGDQLLLLTRLTVPQATGAALENAVRFLTRMAEHILTS